MLIDMMWKLNILICFFLTTYEFEKPFRCLPPFWLSSSVYCFFISFTRIFLFVFLCVVCRRSLWNPYQIWNLHFLWIWSPGVAVVRSLGMGGMCELCWGSPPGRSPFGMSICEQIEEEGWGGGGWVGETGDGWVQSPTGRYCCLRCTKIINNLGFWRPGISWASGNSYTVCGWNILASGPSEAQRLWFHPGLPF